MNNLPNEDRENLIDTNEEISTVFSDPTTQYKKVAKKEKKARWPMVVAAVLSVVLLFGGAFAVVKFIPELKDDATEQNTEISVLFLNQNNITAVDLENKNGSYEFYSETEGNLKNWYVKGYEKEVVNSDFISDIVGYVSNVTAFREITSKSLSDCGLETPEAKAVVTMSDNSKVSVLVGKNSPDNRGTYLKVSNSEKIYLVETFEAETLIFEEIALANSDSFKGVKLGLGYGDYIIDDSLEKFDTLTVTGKNLETPVVIEMNKNETISEYATYVVTKPSERIANNVDELFGIFKSGLTVDGAYSFDVSDKSIRKVGLDNPDFTATLKIKDKTFVYKFKLQDDGNYAVVSSDSVNIKMVSPSYLGFIDYKTVDFYSNWVCMQTLDKLSAVVFKTADKEYNFEITSEEKNTYKIACNGKTIKEDYFKAFFEELISLTCSEYNVEKLNAQSEIVITFKYNDSAKDTVISFTKATETKYQYNVNGIDMGKLSSSSLRKVIKYAEKVAQNQSIK